MRQNGASGESGAKMSRGKGELLLDRFRCV